jgi:hypothetical protein
MSSLNSARLTGVKSGSRPRSSTYQVGIPGKKATIGSLAFKVNDKENKNPCLKTKAPSMAKIP